MAVFPQVLAGAASRLPEPDIGFSLWRHYGWQIELYFKELKSTLGYDQYQLRRFAAVEGWVQACLIAFVYLEYYRWRKLRQASLPERARAWWQAQRSHGLSRHVQQEVEAADWAQLYRWSGTRSGQRKWRRWLGAALPKDQRPAA